MFVCLHGGRTWGYLYRNFIPRLTRLGRVVVPDHMGFGKSETPQDREYTLEEHVDNLERLLLHLDLTGVTLIVQDWGGPIGASFAYRQFMQRLLEENDIEMVRAIPAMCIHGEEDRALPTEFAVLNSRSI